MGLQRGNAGPQSGTDWRSAPSERTGKVNAVERSQLVHNESVDGKGARRTSCAASGARTPEEATLRRLVQSIMRYLHPERARELAAEAGVELPFEYMGAKSLRGAHLLTGVWRRLGVGAAAPGPPNPEDQAREVLVVPGEAGGRVMDRHRSPCTHEWHYIPERTSERLSQAAKQS
jgi:hypothetical protein